jgi:hypothetical protein
MKTTILSLAQGENMINRFRFWLYRVRMCMAAKSIQGGNFPGCGYYMQHECWGGYWEDGVTPYDAVIEDMGYWDE